MAGLLRNAADELGALGHPLAAPERIVSLFGSEGTQSRARLVVRGLRFRRRDQGDPLRPRFFVVSSTAREVYSRRPLDDTLRTVEMAGAGLEARGEARFFGDEEDKGFILLCLKRLSSVGGGKTRGAGQIRLRHVTVYPAPGLEPLPPPPEGPCCLRLLLRNLEPLCIPKTGFPGNVIESESYIPGSALRGAILQAITDRGYSSKEVDRLAAGDIRFGNGYYVPESLLDGDGEGRISGLENLVALPLPLTAEEAKATERKADLAAGPWWAEEGTGRGFWLEDTSREWDSLLPEARLGQGADPSGREARFKRIKSEDYLAGPATGPFFRVRPAMVTLMRNRIPVGREERTFDSRRPGATGGQFQGPGELYSAEALAEEQLFLAEIGFDSGEALRAFCGVATPLLGGPDGRAEDRAWLRVGRGGSPMRVESYAWCKPKEKQWEEPRPSPEFTLTLTSDLIARAADLTFYTTLDGRALVALMGLPEDYAPRVQINTQASRSETRLVYGFNTAASTRRTAAVAIKRGSALLIQGEQEAVSQLFRRLAAVESAGKGLGERQEEGFGRFALDHPMHRRPAPTATGTKVLQARGEGLRTAQTPEAEDRRQRERALRTVLAAVEAMRLSELSGRKDFPSRNQWQWLRHCAEVARNQADLDGLFTHLRDHASKLSGRMWACPCPDGRSLWQAMQGACCEAGDFASQRLFLVYLCRWIVGRLDRVRQESKGV